jgi:hypothetical protein
MSDTYRIVGTTNGATDVEIGTTGVGYTTVGEIQSATNKLTGDTVELKTRKGNVFAVVFLNNMKEGSFEAIWDDDFTIPARGDAITVFGAATFLVMDVEEKWAAGKEKMISISVKQFTDVLAVA